MSAHVGYQYEYLPPSRRRVTPAQRLSPEPCP